MAQLADNPYPIPEIDFSKGYMEGMKAQDSTLEALMDISSNVNIEKGEVVGLIYKESRGDGFAYYLVTKERPLTLQHIPYCDAWQLEPPNKVKKITKKDVIACEARRRDLIRIFGAKSPAVELDNGH